MYIPTKWKTPKVVSGLMAVEFCFTVAMLAMVGIASPDLYRTRMWQDGADNGFNSNPNQILYAYANYRPIPSTPLVWSQFITNFNLVIAVLSMFLLLVKAVMHVMTIWYPLLSIITHAILTALYAVSVYGQAGPDHSDPEHPSSVAWYIAKSCNVVFHQNNKHYCQMAKATFAVTVVMLAILFFHIPLSIYSLIPSAKARQAHAHKSSLDSDVEMTKGSPISPVNDKNEEARWALGPVPSTPYTPGRNPMTPRTMAFNTLDRQLPLRG